MSDASRHTPKSRSKSAKKGHEALRALARLLARLAARKTQSPAPTRSESDGRADPNRKKDNVR